MNTITDSDSVRAARVAVIGGGLAGIAAALQLADGGARVQLIERRPRLGGLTWSFKRNGIWFDNGQHVFMRCCSAYRDFLQRIGSSHLVELQPRLDVPVLSPKSRGARLRRSRLPAPLHLGGALARYAPLPASGRVKLVRAALALRGVDPGDPHNDEVTFGDWLREHGQSQRAIDTLWDLIAKPTLNVPAEEASLAAAAFVFRTGLLEHNDAADIGWSRVPLARLHGDAATLALGAAGVDVSLGSTVAAVAEGPSVVFDHERVDVDAVVVATGHQAAQGLLPEGALAHQTELMNLGESPIVNVHLVFDRRLTDLAFAAVIDSPVEYVFDRTQSSGLSSGQYLVVSLSAADAHLTTHPRALIPAMVDALGAVFPSASRSTLVDAMVTRERAATFAPRPGAARLRPGPSTRAEGVFVAGAWTDTGWPATMEGAVRSGVAAAAAVLEHRVSSRSTQEVIR